MIVSRKFRSLVLLLFTLLNSAAITPLVALEVDDDIGECSVGDDGDGEGSCSNADAAVTVSMAANNNVDELSADEKSVEIVILDNDDDADDDDDGDEKDFSDIEQEILNQLTKMMIEDTFKFTTKVTCRDGDDNCIFWAKEGECKSNPDYMISNCQCACSEQFNLPMPMNRLLKAVKKYGVPQEVRGIESQETLTAISNTLTYMENLSDKFDDMSDVDLLTSCKNLEKRCSFWAGLGECNNNPGNEYMRLHCAPACQECNVIDIQTRCPSLGVAPPALVPGGLNTMFERIVLNVPTEDNIVDYTVNILSRPGESNVNIKEESFFRDFAQPPWLITLDNFLTDEEANDLIELGNNHKYEVITLEQTDGQTDMMGVEVDSITSRQCTGKISWCTYADDCRTDTLIEKIQDRISKVTGIPVVNSEHLEIVKYEVGDYYRKHNDYILSQQGGRAGSRVLSFFVYLSDDDEDDGGGNLNFPTLKKKIRPKKGTAVLWPTVRNSNPTDVDLRTDYEIEDVKHGTVYSVATWLHLHEYDFGCT